MNIMNFYTIVKKISRLLLSLIFSMLCVITSAQQLSEEPVGGIDETELEDIEPIPVVVSSPLPILLNFEPLATYYPTWDTLNVRRNALAPSEITQPICLPLFNKFSIGFVFPVEGKLLSPFGYRGRRVHAGIDIKLVSGDPVSAAFDGIVRLAKTFKGYGKCLVIRHFNGLETLYGHLSKIEVHVNQAIKAGEVIGLGGHTGRATCSHLHFETRFQGRAFNPKQIINLETYSLSCDTFYVTPATFGLSRDYMPESLTASDDSTTLTTLADGKTVVNKKAVKKTTPKYHTIRKGETLSAISRKYGTSVNQLCSLNKIKKTKVLQLGTRLRVR
jgi:murein DD-endopeptidase MepM/ murein hydrolase activator NlpD